MEQFEAIKDRRNGDIRYLFEHKEEDYHKPVGNFWSKNHTECESKGDISVEEWLNKIRPYLKSDNMEIMINDKADEVIE